MAIFGVISVLLGPVLWAVGGWALIQETTTGALAAFRSIPDPDKTVEAYGKLIGAVGLLLAATVGLLGVGVAVWRSWNEHRDGVLTTRKLKAEFHVKSTETFAKAVDHLGSEKPSVRIDAVLSLEALGKATTGLLSQAIEILYAFVRENRFVSIESRTAALALRLGASSGHPAPARMKPRNDRKVIFADGQSLERKPKGTVSAKDGPHDSVDYPTTCSNANLVPSTGRSADGRCYRTLTQRLSMS